MSRSLLIDEIDRRCRVRAFSQVLSDFQVSVPELDADRQQTRRTHIE
jgi:hypothetical protein